GTGLGGDAHGDTLIGIENLVGTNYTPLPDFLTGNGADNRLEGLAGDDILTGLGGDDRFVFGPNSGRDTITDFVAGAGTEVVIDLTALTGFDSVAQVTARTTQPGADAVIDLGGGGNSIPLLGVNAGILHEDDFLFVV